MRIPRMVGAALVGVSSCAPVTTDVDRMRTPPTTGVIIDLRTMHPELDGELAQHADIMTAAIDLAAARAEIERHAGIVAATMRAMDGAMGQTSRPR